MKNKIVLKLDEADTMLRELIKSAHMGMRQLEQDKLTKARDAIQSAISQILET